MKGYEGVKPLKIEYKINVFHFRIGPTNIFKSGKSFKLLPPDVTFGDE